MRYIISIILFAFLAKDSFAQKELCINNVKSGRLIVIDPLTSVFYKLKSDPTELSKDPNDISIIKVGKANYHHGDIVRMTDNALVISREIVKGKNKIDTIPLNQFTSIGKYRTGTGQKIIGVVLAVSTVFFIASAVKEHNKVKSPLDKEEGTSVETLDTELGVISILGSAFCFIYPTHKEYLLGEKWNLTIRKHQEQN